MARHDNRHVSRLGCIFVVPSLASLPEYAVSRSVTQSEVFKPTGIIENGRFIAKQVLGGP